MYVAASSSAAPSWRAASTPKQTADTKDSQGSDNASAAQSGNARGSDSVAVSGQSQGEGSASSSSKSKGLTDDQKQEVDKLKKRDSEVRRHEAAHLAAAGGTARSGAVFDFEAGPDGQQYAVGGHVNIDLSPVAGNPSATIAKMQQVQGAALAPADPSGQDRAVASQAAAEAQKARAEVSQEQSPSGSGVGGAGNSGAKSDKSGSGPGRLPTSPNDSGSLLDVTA